MSEIATAESRMTVSAFALPSRKAWQCREGLGKWRPRALTGCFEATKLVTGPALKADFLSHHADLRTFFSFPVMKSHPANIERWSGLCLLIRRAPRSGGAGGAASSAGGVPHPLLSPLATPELSASDDSSLSDGLPREEGERGFGILVSWAPA